MPQREVRSKPQIFYRLGKEYLVVGQTKLCQLTPTLR